MSLSIHDQIRRTVLTDAFMALRTIMDDTRDECIRIIEEISSIPSKVGAGYSANVVDTSCSVREGNQDEDANSMNLRQTPSVSIQQWDDQQRESEVHEQNGTGTTFVSQNDPVSHDTPFKDPTAIERIAEVLRGMIKRVYGLQISALPINQLRLLACLLGLLKKQKDTGKVSTNHFISKNVLVVRLEAYHCEKNPLGKRQRKTSSDTLDLEAQFLSIKPKKYKKEPKTLQHKNLAIEDANPDPKAGKKVTSMKSITLKNSFGEIERKPSSDNLVPETQFLSIKHQNKNECNVLQHKNLAMQDPKAGKKVTSMKRVLSSEGENDVRSTVLSAADLLSHYFAPSSPGASMGMYSVVDELVSDDDSESGEDNVNIMNSGKKDAKNCHSELVIGSHSRFTPLADSSKRQSFSKLSALTDAEDVLVPAVTVSPMVISDGVEPPQGHDIIFNVLRMGEPLVLELAAELLLKQKDTLDGTVTTLKTATVLAREIFDYLLKRNVAVEEHKTLFILG